MRRRQVDGGLRRRRGDYDDGIETDGGKMLIQIGILAEGVFDDDGVRPLDFNVLSDQQSIFVAGCNHQ